MNTYTSNINIESPKGVMSYLINYENSRDYINKNKVSLYQRPDKILDFKLDLSLKNDFNLFPLKKYKSYWKEFDESGKIYDIFFQKDQIKLSKLKLIFPLFSVDIYKPNVKYAISACIWISGVKIYLCSYIINRINAIALSPVKEYLGNKYYEYIEIPIIDPYEIMYSDDWMLFRLNICHELENTNNLGSTINVTLYPISESLMSNEYIPIDEYVGSLNSLNLHNNNDEYLTAQLYFNENTPGFELNLNYNKQFQNLYEYVYETYNLELNKIKYKFNIFDKDNIYIESIHVLDPIKLNEKIKITKEDFYFSSFEDWSPGLFAAATVTLLCTYSGLQKLPRLLEFNTNNKIPLTKDIMKYFINNNGFIEKIDLNLNYTNMNIYNIDAINKTELNIILLDKPEDSKSNISYPVFYKVEKLNNIIIHPEVTENICIGLDSYKSLAKKFLLQVEGISFKELGRTSAGVIFKITGNSLPKKKMQGLYYINNEKNEVITSGNYKYIM